MTNIPLLVASLAGGAADAVAMGRSQDEFCRAAHARLAMEPDLDIDQRAKLTLFAEQAFTLAQPAPALKTYRVTLCVDVTQEGFIEVNASSEEEAKQKAREHLEAGDIRWHDKETSEVAITNCRQVTA
jgi:hypothetical protein